MRFRSPPEASCKDPNSAPDGSRRTWDGDIYRMADYPSLVAMRLTILTVVEDRGPSCRCWLRPKGKSRRENLGGLTLCAASLSLACIHPDSTPRLATSRHQPLAHCNPRIQVAFHFFFFFIRKGTVYWYLIICCIQLLIFHRVLQ